MALIICKKCGEKISDASERCIHCGAPISEAKGIDRSHNVGGAKDNGSDLLSLLNDIAASESSNSVDDDPEANDGDESNKLKDFGSLSAEKKNALEDEFLKNDKWARRYFRQMTEFAKFRRMFYMFIGLFILTVICMRVFFKEELLVIEYICYRPEFILAAFIAFLLLGAFTLLMFLYGILGPIYFGITRKRYVYSKRFKIWLEQNKNIEYNPPIMFNRGKQIFDNIVIK